MNVLKMVCGSLGAVILTAGSIWAFAEPTPPPMAAAPIAACSAGKCGANACPATKCDQTAVSVVSNCQKKACSTAATTKKFCDKTIPVAVTNSECKASTCESSCDEQVSADACPAASKKCCDKTIPVAVTESCCKAESACVTKSNCKSSACGGKTDGCDGDCCKAGTCESACCDEKVTADACPASKECCEKTIPVAVTDSACKNGACPVSAKSACKSECSAKDKDCDGECCKDGTCKSACCNEKVSANACPASAKECCDKTVPVAVTKSECKDGTCKTARTDKGVSTTTCTITAETTGDRHSRLTLIVDKDATEQSCVTNGEVTLTVCPNTKCAEKTVAVTATKSQCQDGACPVSATSACESKCDNETCATAKVAASSPCKNDACATNECAGANACTASGGCQAACPTSRKPVIAETPDKTELQPQASRSHRLRIGFRLARGSVTPVVETKSTNAFETFPREQQRQGVLKGSHKIASALAGVCVKTAVPTIVDSCLESSCDSEKSASRQRPGATHVVIHNDIVAPRPVAGCVITDDGRCSLGAGFPHECRLEGHHPLEFVDAVLGPPSAHVTYTAHSCPMCAHQHPATRPPVFHGHPVHGMGPSPGYVHLEFSEFPRLSTNVVGPIVVPGPPPEHHGFHGHGMPRFAPPLPVFAPPMPPLPHSLAWRHHAWMLDQDRDPQGPIWGPPAMDHSAPHPHHGHFHPAPPRIPIQAVSFEGDAPAPGAHLAQRPASHPRRDSMPIEGSWVQQVGETTIRFTCEPSRVQGTVTIAADGADDARTIDFSGTCSITPDGQLFGVIDHLSINGLPDNEARDSQKFESQMLDQPFAIRFRTDGDTLFVKDVKCAGVAKLGIEATGDGDSVLNMFGCGKYTRDAE